MTKRKIPIELIVECKGLCYPNPSGLMSWAYLIYRPEEYPTALEISTGSRLDGKASNYRAYFYGVVCALEKLIELGLDGKAIELRSDMKGAINQINNYHPPYDYFFATHSDLLDKIAELRKKFTKIRLTWIERNNFETVSRLAETALTTHVGSAPETAETK